MKFRVSSWRWETRFDFNTKFAFKRALYSGLRVLGEGLASTAAQSGLILKHALQFKAPPLHFQEICMCARRADIASLKCGRSQNRTLGHENNTMLNYTDKSLD
jgi:hypothetical protein